jgi:TonB family protein
VPHPSEPAQANPNPPSSPPAPAGGGGGGGGSPVAPGESDSDPFNKSISVVVRPGGIEARSGRALRKTVKPDLTLAAQTDLMAAGGGRVQLAVRIDSTGGVADVKVLSSSGFPDVDLSCIQAMYQWVIEPSKDKAGHAVSDVIIITINFQ